MTVAMVSRAEQLQIFQVVGAAFTDRMNVVDVEEATLLTPLTRFAFMRAPPMKFESHPMPNRTGQRRPAVKFVS